MQEAEKTLLRIENLIERFEDKYGTSDVEDVIGGGSGDAGK